MMAKERKANKKTERMQKYYDNSYVPKAYHARPEAACYKIRVISYNNNGEEVLGITIPNSIGSEFKGCFFEIKKEEGNILVLTSGGKLQHPSFYENEK